MVAESAAQPTNNAPCAFRTTADAIFTFGERSTFFPARLVVANVHGRTIRGGEGQEAAIDQRQYDGLHHQLSSSIVIDLQYIRCDPESRVFAVILLLTNFITIDRSIGFQRKFFK